MKTGKFLQIAWRLGVCLALVIAVVAYFAHELAHAIPLLSVFGWAIIGVAVIGAALLVTIIAQGSFNQWTFRNGGIDPQWLWFREDPPGTAQLRELRRDENQ